ncbi:hypothetical protein [Paucibacter sp. TC2R-5]|uniref:hypothetical protein n=1 Tax=Paucibacter sp. TC2R-5 TaxID=2893555 RepID=UPI0021E3BCFD|nr:hypothetical protein [Paucibacter sp. TC2R-5]
MALAPNLLFCTVMARYEHPPIYKAALDLTVHMEKLVAGFSRNYKYVPGTVLGSAGSGELAHLLNALRWASSLAANARFGHTTDLGPRMQNANCNRLNLAFEQKEPMPDLSPPLLPR